MHTFQVDDMTCGHCAGAITQALKAADPTAQVRIDLASHRVHVESRATDREVLAAAIRESGYTPVPV